MIRHFASKQFVAFLMIGGVSAAINFGSRIVFSFWFGFSFSIFLAFLTGITTAFILSKIFVFKESQQTLKRSAFYFLLVNIFALIQTWLISMILAYYLLPAAGFFNYTNEIAHGAGVIFPVFSSYLGHKYWSFR